MPSLMDLSQALSLDPPAESGQPPGVSATPRPHASPFPTAAYQPLLQLDDPTLTPAPADFNELTTSKVYPTIPGYTIVGELARRRWGVVYQAADQQRRRSVALKVIEAGGAVGAEALARLQAEAAAIGGIQQPGVVEVLEMNAWRGQDFMVQEYVPAPTLAQFLRGEPQPADASARFILQLADVLAGLHQQKIIHGDLQPAHLFVVPPADDPECNRFGVLRESNSPKVYGFGYPQASQFHRERRRDGVPDSLHRYLAPERLQVNFRAWKPTVDVYSLGAILHELLTGKAPFAEVAAADLPTQIASVVPPVPSARHKAVPAPLDAIVSRCLRKLPKERYPTAAALANDLRRFLAKQPLAAEPASANSGWKLAAGIVGFGVLTFGLAVSVLLWGPDVVRWLNTPRTDLAAPTPTMPAAAAAEKAPDPTPRPKTVLEPKSAAPSGATLAPAAWQAAWVALAQRLLDGPEAAALSPGTKEALRSLGTATSPADALRLIQEAESRANSLPPGLRFRLFWQPAADIVRQAPASTDPGVNETLADFFVRQAQFALDHAKTPEIDPRAAAQAFAQALQRYPYRDARRADLHVRRAKSLIERVGWEKLQPLERDDVANDAEVAVQLNPQAGAAWNLKGFLALRTDPNDTPSTARLTRLFAAVEAFGKAIDRAESQTPPDALRADYYVNRAIAQAEIGGITRALRNDAEPFFRRALEDSKKALAVSPDHEVALATLGHAAEMLALKEFQGDPARYYPLAVEAFQKRLEHQGTGHGDLGRCLTRWVLDTAPDRGKLERAAGLLAADLKRQPTADAYYWHACVQQALGHQIEAREDYAQAARLGGRPLLERIISHLSEKPLELRIILDRILPEQPAAWQPWHAAALQARAELTRILEPHDLDRPNPKCLRDFDEALRLEPEKPRQLRLCLQAAQARIDAATKITDNPAAISRYREEVIALLVRCIDLDPKSPEVLGWTKVLADILEVKATNRSTSPTDRQAALQLAIESLEKVRPHAAAAERPSVVRRIEDLRGKLQNGVPAKDEESK